MSNQKTREELVQVAAAGLGATVGALTKKPFVPGHPMRAGLSVQVGSAVGAAAPQGAGVVGATTAGVAVFTAKAAAVGAGAAKVAAVGVMVTPVLLPALVFGALGYGVFRLYSDY